MALKIKHTTSYTYSEPVYPEPHYLYFYPAHRSFLQLRDFQLAVSPEPAGLAFRLDAENNPFHQIWFLDSIEELKLEIDITIETFSINPFNFLLEAEPRENHLEALSIFLRKLPLHADLIEWMKSFSGITGDNPITLISYINKEIHADWKHINRYETNLMDVNECFHSKKGSCRDLSWMLIQILRNQNIPARFVSGYAFNPSLDEGHELHAWVEAYLPGAGWIGLDPSSGLLATDLYIPVATSHIPQNTLPVQGSYRGNAQSDLDFNVEITEIQ